MADLLNGNSRAEYEGMKSRTRSTMRRPRSGLAQYWHCETTMKRRRFQASSGCHYDANSISPTAWAAYAKLEPDRPRANDALEHALEFGSETSWRRTYMLGERKHDVEQLKKATGV